MLLISQVASTGRGVAEEAFIAKSLRWVIKGILCAWGLFLLTACTGHGGSDDSRS
jgi:hypothetical protein